MKMSFWGITEVKNRVRERFGPFCILNQTALFIRANGNEQKLVKEAGFEANDLTPAPSSDSIAVPARSFPAQLQLGNGTTLFHTTLLELSVNF